jgi:hypothetical protein
MPANDEAGEVFAALMEWERALALAAGGAWPLMNSLSLMGCL